MKSLFVIETLICKFFENWPVILRCALWVSAAMLTQILADLKGLNRETVNQWFWKDWILLFGAPVLQGLLIWRTYLDQSFARHQDKAGTSYEG